MSIISALFHLYLAFCIIRSHAVLVAQKWTSAHLYSELVFAGLRTIRFPFPFAVYWEITADKFVRTPVENIFSFYILGVVIVKKRRRLMSELGRSGGVDDDPEDGLWREFENCAQAVAHLFRCANWRNLQTAAASTTQLYKSGLDSKKRAFERGFLSGRQALAKEIFSLCRYSTTIDVEEVVTLLSRYALLPEHSSTSSGNASSPHRRQRNLPAANSSTTAGIEGPSAVNLFQQVGKTLKRFHVSCDAYYVSKFGWSFFGE